MHKYVIYDIWMGLRTAWNHFFGWIVLVWGLMSLPYLFTKSGEYEMPTSGVFFYSAVVITVITFVMSIFIYFANRGYVIELETGLITFPRADVENSILAIILMYPYWNQMRTKTIHASEIENLFLDTKRWSTQHRVATGRTTAKGKAICRTETRKHVSYNINIVGTFGSANLAFLERQKRDEVRNAIQKCVKQHSDINIDRKVAEFN